MFRRAAKTKQCETCGRWLTPKRAVEITDIQTGKFGFTSITATYCKADAPEERAA